MPATTSPSFPRAKRKLSKVRRGWGGYVQFYPVNALAEAGAHVDTFANWHPNVVVDRELITGQQPMSAEEFGNTLVSKLNGSSN
jgi:putative intracellular protease/amidase